ncbi:MAG: J domain-containing protein [Candidatus Hydrogenedentes bacterium]|nr:J domain-containing protein [Candidatus Hydrogenedentota bacterium]
MTGLWPQVIRALRELRGEHLPDPPAGSSRDAEVCFRLLGLSPSASWEEIERAYRKKAKIHHPDRGGDDDAMRALNEAYNKIKAIRRT